MVGASSSLWRSPQPCRLGGVLTIVQLVPSQCASASERKKCDDTTQASSSAAAPSTHQPSSPASAGQVSSARLQLAPSQWNRRWPSDWLTKPVSHSSSGAVARMSYGWETPGLPMSVQIPPSW